MQPHRDPLAGRLPGGLRKPDLMADRPLEPADARQVKGAEPGAGRPPDSSGRNGAGTTTSWHGATMLPSGAITTARLRIRPPAVRSNMGPGISQMPCRRALSWKYSISAWGRGCANRVSRPCAASSLHSALCVKGRRRISMATRNGIASTLDCRALAGIWMPASAKDVILMRVPVAVIAPCQAGAGAAAMRRGPICAVPGPYSAHIQPISGTFMP